MKEKETNKIVSLLEMRELLKTQKADLEGDLSEVENEIKAIIKAEGQTVNDKGSQRVILWREDGKIQELDHRFSDKLTLVKNAAEILVDHEFWDIYKEEAIEPKKVKAILDSEDVPEGLEDKVVKSRGGWSLAVSKPKDPTAQQILDKQQEDKLQKEASETF